MDSSNKIIIAGRMFEMDFTDKTLSQSSYPTNKVGIDAFEKNGGFLSAGIMEVAGKIIFLPTDSDLKEHKITFPEEVLSGRFAGNLKHANDVNNESYKNDWNVLLIDEAINKRLFQGQLPIIDVVGDSYFVDWRLKEMRLTSDFMTRIPLQDLEMTDNGEKYLCLYHPPSKQVIPSYIDVKDLPKGTVVLEIPNELKLDPISVAREYGLQEVALLHKHRINPDLKAEKRTLEDYGLVQKRQVNNKKSPTESKKQNRKRGRRL